MRFHADARRDGWFDIFPREVVEVNVVSIHGGKTAGSWHGHIHQDDVWMVISGVLRVGLATSQQIQNKGYDERILRPGMQLTIPRGVWHTYEALQPTVLIYGLTQRYNEDKPDELRIPFAGKQGEEWCPF